MKKKGATPNSLKEWIMIYQNSWNQKMIFMKQRD